MGALRLALGAAFALAASAAVARGGTGTPVAAAPGQSWIVPMLAADGLPDVLLVEGRALAGPVCPVERIPPDPACAPRPVAGAVLIVRDMQREEVARLMTDDDGVFQVGLPPGLYVLVSQPVAGLLGTPGPMVFAVSLVEPLVAFYDTGIR